MNRTGIENRVPGCEGTICLSWEYKKSICVIFKTCKYSSLVRYFFLNVPYSRQKCLLAISCYTNNLHYIPYWYVWQLWQPMGNSPVIITADLPIQMKTELLCMDEFITGNVLLVSPMDIFPTCWLFKIGILKKKGKKTCSQYLVTAPKTDAIAGLWSVFQKKLTHSSFIISQAVFLLQKVIQWLHIYNCNTDTL